jgi:hypothetical protein
LRGLDFSRDPAKANANQPSTSGCRLNQALFTNVSSQRPQFSAERHKQLKGVVRFLTLFLWGSAAWRFS